MSPPSPARLPPCPLSSSQGIVTSEEALAMLNEGEESSIDGRLKSLIAQVCV